MSKMNFQFSRLSMAFGFIGIIFYAFIGMFTGYSGIPTFPNANQYFNWSIIYANAVKTMGGNWGFFSGLQSVLIILASPFIYIGNVFIYIGLVFAWIGSILIYPFTLMPYPINFIIPSLIGMMLAISIISSLRIVSSGID